MSITATDRTISLLILNDIHVGVAGDRDLFPGMEEDLHRDLEEVHAQAGPFDLVLLPGDLTCHGQARQFEELDRRLGRLWRRLRGLGLIDVN